MAQGARRSTEVLKEFLVYVVFLCELCGLDFYASKLREIFKFVSSQPLMELGP